jgi:hypothetical protein
MMLNCLATLKGLNMNIPGFNPGFILEKVWNPRQPVFALADQFLIRRGGSNPLKTKSRPT